ncbi:hypothetical protein ACHAP5_003869 [Fusarium lateritium]
MEDQIARFSIWTSNMAVFAKSKMSLDHRLRWTPQVRDLVTGLLGVLKDCIDEFAALLEKLGSSHLSSPRRNELLASGVFEQALLSISNEITLLNEISNTIRKANRKTQDAKAMGDFTMRDDDGNDIEKPLYDAWAENMLDRFPGCNETIRLRLAWTMVLRRRRIIYRRHRHSGQPFRVLQTSDKPSLRSLPGETEGEAHTRRFLRSANQGGSPSVLASTAIRSATTLALPDFQKAQAPSAVSKSRTIALDSHEGLVFPRAPGRLLRGRSKRNQDRSNPHPEPGVSLPVQVLTNTPSSAGLHQHNHQSQAPPPQHQAAGPPPPVLPLDPPVAYYPPSSNRDIYIPRDPKPPDGSKIPHISLASARDPLKTLGIRAETFSGVHGHVDVEEVCPFCLFILSNRDIRSQQKWREHVTGDLEAYVCLFEECDEPYQIWTRSESWLKHMKQHAIRWSCPAKSHRDQPFFSQQEFQRHLEKDHSKKYSEAELSLVITRSRKSAGPLFTSCPLCGQEAKEFTENIEKHIAGHLRSLALKSLPPSYDEKDDEEDDSSDKKSDGAVSNRSTVLGLIDDETSTFETGIEAAQTSAEHQDSNVMVKSDIPLSKQISELLHEDQITLELVSREVFNKMSTRDKLTTNWQIPHHMALVQESDLGNHEDNPFLWLCRSVALNVVRRYTAGDCGGIDDVTHGKLVSLVQQAVQSSSGEVEFRRQGGHNDSSKAEFERHEPVDHVAADLTDESSEFARDADIHPLVKRTNNPGLATSRSDGSKWRCPLCSVEFVQHYDLKDHILTHVNTGSLTCSMCRVEVSHLQAMEIHIKNPHQKSSPKVPALPTEGASSYWCEFEATLFPYLLRSFGSKWEAIAAFMGTKTATMVKNYYRRRKDEVDAHNGPWEEIVTEADKNWAETLSRSPADFPISISMKIHNTDVSLGSASGSPHSLPQMFIRFRDGAPEEEEEEIVRCICNSEDFPGLAQEAKLHYRADDIVDADLEGLFVQCDSCQVWQHGGCIGILDEGQSPMGYFCEQCRPKLHEKHVASDG